MIPKARYPLTASEMDYINSRQVDPASIEQIADEHGTLERLARTALVAERCPPLIPKKWLAGRRYRLKPAKRRTVAIDTHGIVDWPMPERDWPPTRWLGYVMGYVKEDLEPVDWNTTAMAQRLKRIFPKLA